MQTPPYILLVEDDEDTCIALADLCEKKFDGRISMAMRFLF